MSIFLGGLLLGNVLFQHPVFSTQKINSSINDFLPGNATELYLKMYPNLNDSMLALQNGEIGLLYGGTVRQNFSSTHPNVRLNTHQE